MAIESGTRLGRYEICSPLGKGGTGEVYLANDTYLNRPIALKFLSPAFNEDKEHLNRFIQEARATSALNHPNIITIYEIEYIDSNHFIAMEFIDGLNLEQHIAVASMKIIEVLDIAAQVTSAIAASHEAGIVHRDIKPGNIMIRRDGHVKVLDFGVAKLFKQSSMIDVDASSGLLINTASSAILGTVNYMSPEQASGLDIDARTDIWSLGCVLFEMVTGEMLFKGTITKDVLLQIQESDPLALAHSKREIPELLEWIMAKALTPDRDERYQSAREMLVDLRNLKRRLELETEMKFIHAPVIEPATDILPDDRDNIPAAEKEQKNTPVTVTEKSADQLANPTTLASKIKRHKTGIIVGVVAIIIAVGAIVFTSKQQGDIRNPSTTPSSSIKISRLTAAEEWASNAHISPNGKYIAFTRVEEGGPSLWVRQVSQDTPVRILTLNKEFILDTSSFSPDSATIYYVAFNNKTQQGALYQIPVSGPGGSNPRYIRGDIKSSVTLSPDGRHFAFINYKNAEESSLVIANSDGSGSFREIKTVKSPEWFHKSIAWMPDAKKLVCAIAPLAKGGFSLVEVAIEDGETKVLTSQKWRRIGQLLWSKNNSGIIMVASEGLGDRTALWHLSYPKGEAQKITQDASNYGFSTLSMTEDGTTLLAETTRGAFGILVADNQNTNQISYGEYDGTNGLCWAPDGRIVYSSIVEGSANIWVMNSDGTEKKPLTSDPPADFSPVATNDGRYIVFVSEREGNINHIWRMNMDGSHLTLLSKEEGMLPACSPDSKWVVFVSRRSGHETLLKVPIDGGQEAVPISVLDLSFPHFSPDGKSISCLYFTENATQPPEPVIVSFQNGRIVAYPDIPKSPPNAPCWTPDGRAYIYINVQAGVPNIWRQRISDGSRFQETKFQTGSITGFDISRDGNRFAFSMGGEANEIVQITDFKIQ